MLSFGPYRLDPERGQLRRGTQIVKLTPKALAVLRYVVERPGQIVTKEELFRAVWAETVVSDAALTYCIQEVRRALRDDAKKPRYIETVHRRGFRLIAAVTEQIDELAPHFERIEEPLVPVPFFSPAPAPLEDPNTSFLPAAPAPAIAGEEHGEGFPRPSQANGKDQTVPPAPQRYWPKGALALAGLLLLVGLVGVVQYLSLRPLAPSAPSPSEQPQPLPLPDKPSIVVLPFTNLSGDPGQEYFSDGLTDVLTGDLSKISTLFVISRNSAFTYKGKAVKVQDVGQEMGVRYVLEGSVQKADQRVRITAQLIDATTGYHLWSEQYDRPLTDIFALQDEIVQKIVTTLKLQLTLQEHGYIMRKRTDNVEAYDAFLRGVEYLFRFTKEANAQARQLFEQALTLDPQYAEAYAWLGVTYRLEWVMRWSTAPQTLERVLALAHQTRALDDSLPGARWLLSFVYTQQQQYDQAIAQGERAITLDPNNADSYAVQASVLNLAGRPEEALRMVKQAMRLNPRYPPWYLLDLGAAFRMTGRYAEAITALKEAVNRSPNELAHLGLAASYLFQWISQQSTEAQTLAQALAAAQQVLALNNASAAGHALLGYVYLWQKQYESALAEMERAIALAPTEAIFYALLAEALGCVGRPEDAIATVEQALRRTPFVADEHLSFVGAAYDLAGRPEEALAPLQRYLARYPNILGARLMLAAVYSELGREAEAWAEAAEVLRLNPQFSLPVHRQRVPIKDPVVLERHLATLRKAGLK